MALNWQKSSYSKDWNQALCVEVATVSGGRFVRDSKDPTGHVLEFTDASWAGFTQWIKEGH